MAEVLSKRHLTSPCSHCWMRFSAGRREPCYLGFSRSSSPTLQPLRSSLAGGFTGRGVVFGHQRRNTVRANPNLHAYAVPMTLATGKALRWWEKGVQPSMIEIQSAENLVDSLSNAGEKLVVVGFFSPGCGGCRALHPKICQIAEKIPDVLFLQVNYEEHKSMCYSLNVHVLPFFRFYRGAQGRLCSFSCTNATIKKFKDALAKYKAERCGCGPAKGLEEKELLALAANKDLSFNYIVKPLILPTAYDVATPGSPKFPASPIPVAVGDSEDKNLVTA